MNFLKELVFESAYNFFDGDFREITPVSLTIGCR